MTASATISIEIELGWGFHDQRPPSEVPELSGDGEAERAALRRLLNLCDEFDVPITFNVVGHLLLDSCDGSHDGPHPEGWFERDPGTDVATDPLFYAPEVVDWIRDAAVDHEICTHTFSHVLCDEVVPGVVDWELARVDDLHDESIESLVPPRHRDPPRDVLRSHGIEALRLSVDESPPTGAIGRYRYMLGRSHPVGRLEFVDGVLETRTAPVMTLTSTALSKGVAPPHPAFRVLPQRLRSRRQRSFLLDGLDRAVDRDEHIHYWTHCYNLAHESQWPPIRDLFDALERRVSEGAIDVRTMRELVGLCES